MPASVRPRHQHIIELGPSAPPETTLDSSSTPASASAPGYSSNAAASSHRPVYALPRLTSTFPFQSPHKAPDVTYLCSVYSFGASGFFTSDDPSAASLPSSSLESLSLSLSFFSSSFFLSLSFPFFFFCFSSHSFLILSTSFSSSSFRFFSASEMTGSGGTI